MSVTPLFLLISYFSSIFFFSFPPFRSLDQISIHSDSEAFSRPPQGQVPPTHSSVHTQPQVPPTSASQTSPHHLSDSAALQYQQWDHRDQDKDREHPLTRLEIALAEFQRGTSSDSVVSATSHGSGGHEDGGHGPARSLSVLEKVSRFERRERAGKQRSHSTSKATHQRVSPFDCKKFRAPICFN